MLRTARELLAEAMPTIRARGLTLIGVSISNLDGHWAGVQLELPLWPGAAGLDEALDELHGRFGGAAVTRGPAGTRESRAADAAREALISGAGRRDRRVSRRSRRSRTP
jgi:DNA polymerase-4